MRWATLAFAAAFACTAPGVFALGTSGSHPECSTSSTSSSHHEAAPGVARDSHGKIARDPRQLSAFKKQHPCPATGQTYGACPGYTVDHVEVLEFSRLGAGEGFARAIGALGKMLPQDRTQARSLTWVRLSVFLHRKKFWSSQCQRY